jgi:nucleoside-diphosphate-sugar epimerase
VVNDFTAAAATSGRIDMQTEGRAWRSLIHVEDVARMYATLLTAPNEVVRNQVFNAVSENLRVIDIADLVSDLVPGTMRYPRASAFDPQSYQMSGEKFAKAFPSFACHWKAEQGIKQVRDAVTAAGLTLSEWRSDRYRRIARLQDRLERGELDSRLRPRQTQLVS